MNKGSIAGKTISVMIVTAAEKLLAFIRTAACAAFVSLTDNALFTMTIPAKLQTYLACGMPIIAAAAGETDQIIRSAGAGVCCAPGDAKGLVEAILSLSRLPKTELAQMGIRAREYYESNFKKQRLLDKMDECFETSVAGFAKNNTEG